MSATSFCEWRAKYGGMDASLMGRMKELEDENELLRAKVQDLLEELDRKNRDANDWTNHQTESNSSQRQKSAFKISSIGY